MQRPGPAALIWREFLAEFWTPNSASIWRVVFCKLQGFGESNNHIWMRHCMLLQFDQMSNYMECSLDFDLTFGLCHFKFSWAVFTLSLRVSLFWLFSSFELCRGKFVEYQLFVYFLHFKTIYALHFIDIITVSID